MLEPESYPANTGFAKGQRIAFFGCVAGAVVGGLVGALLKLEHDWQVMGTMVGGLCAVCLVLLLPPTRSVFGCVELSERGVALRSRAGDREVEWSEVRRVAISGVSPNAGALERSLGGLGGMFGRVIGRWIERAVAGTVRNAADEVPAVDEIERLLQQQGRGQRRILPQVEVVRSDGTTAFRLRSTHDWDTVEALARAASARGVNVIGMN